MPSWEEELGFWGSGMNLEVGPVNLMSEIRLFSVLRMSSFL